MVNKPAITVSLCVLCWLLMLGAGVVAAQDSATVAQQNDCVTWPRVLPPEGLQPTPERAAAWQQRLTALDQQLRQHQQSSYYADVAVLVKACKFAIEFREFYQEKDFAKCDRLLQLAEDRSRQLLSTAGDNDQRGPGPLPGEEGGRRLQVRGFVSRVDGSAQPVGLIMPENIDAGTGTKLPLYVWLHGRGDKATDMHFICERLDKAGEVVPAGAITLHPFGRHCVGFKSAGSTDVLEAIEFACANYPVDEGKIVLIGFSMGGAGVWHLAAHYADRFVAASPGAGFAETARYQNLSPPRFPAKHVQMLWGVYDVPGYTRNLFNLPLIAYSGELDKQIQAARVMEEAFEAEGRKLEHLIGRGMGHKYHPEVLKDLLKRLEEMARQGKQPQPDSLSLQTKHLQFAKRGWIQIDGMQQQYADTRVDAKRQANGQWELTTKNVSRLQLTLQGNTPLAIDGQPAELSAANKRNVKEQTVKLMRVGAKQWQQVDEFPALRKHPGVSGPIDDAFFGPFMFVTPTKQSSSAARAHWTQCEMAYAITRWTSLMRGTPRVRRDVDVTAEDIDKFHLVLWGDPESNLLMQRILQQVTVPFTWTKDELKIGELDWDASNHIPALIMPNPESLDRYVVINSGLSFRDAHDRTNSLQNPQLPDWAVFSTDQARSPQAAGRLAGAGFFNDQWQFDQELTFSSQNLKGR